MSPKPTKKNTKRTKELRQAKETQAQKPPAIYLLTPLHNYTGDGNWLHAEWLEGRTQRYVVG